MIYSFKIEDPELYKIYESLTSEQKKTVDIEINYRLERKLKDLYIEGMISEQTGIELTGLRGFVS